MQRTIDVSLPNVAATEALAATLAKYAVTGDLIRLEGDLGAGKSTFARAFIKALGSAADHMPSPTYTLMQVYDDARVPVAHLDCYRLSDASELDMLDINEYRTHGIILAEWPEKGGDYLRANQADALPYHIQSLDNPGVLTVHFEINADDSRTAVMSTLGDSWSRRFGLFDDRCRRVPNEADRKAFVDSCNLGDYEITPLKQDWSFRTYWRVTAGEKTYVLMDAPPPQEEVVRYSHIAEWFQSIGLRTAQIYNRDVVKGYLLLEDLGNNCLIDELDKTEKVEPWYKKALDVQLHLAQSPRANIRSYTPQDYWAEVNRVTDWYFPYQRGHATSLAERKAFYNVWQPLIAHLQSLPTSTLIWDYHAANMMTLTNMPEEGFNCMGLLDYQDARIGPLCFDLSILLRDIRRDRDDDLEEKMLTYYLENYTGEVDEAAFRTAFNIASLHHTLRIMGGLSRIAMREGRAEPIKQFMPRCEEILSQCFTEPKTFPLRDYLQAQLGDKLNLKNAA